MSHDDMSFDEWMRDLDRPQKADPENRPAAPASDPSPDDRTLPELLSLSEEDERSSNPPKAEASVGNVMSSLILSEEAEMEDRPAYLSSRKTPSSSSRATQKPRSLFWRILEWLVPHRGDGAREIVRKCVFFAALLVFIGSVAYLFNDALLVPYSNTLLADSVKNLYTPDKPQPLTPDEASFTGYPEGMQESFKKLYYANHDTRGWLSFPSTASDWYTIEYPIVQAADNNYYLTHDFYKTTNKNGTLFFDYRNDFSSPDYYNKLTIVYGHNMMSGQMLASLNRLLRGVDMARSAPLISMDTLYRSSKYKVFAVFFMDEDEANHWRYLNPTLSSEKAISEYLQEAMQRSLYVYGDVDVRTSDEFLLLYTCSNSSQVHASNGRTMVLARRVRDGESETVNTNTIVTNPNPLMPKSWYTSQNLTLPSYYTHASTLAPLPTQPGTGTTASTTKATRSTTSTSPSTAPTEPDIPIYPVIPDDPTQPIVPVDPTNPTEVEPTASTAPTDPTEPTAPTDPTETDPSVTEPSETEPLETEPSEIDPTDNQSGGEETPAEQLDNQE